MARLRGVQKNQDSPRDDLFCQQDLLRVCPDRSTQTGKSLQVVKENRFIFTIQIGNNALTYSLMVIQMYCLYCDIKLCICTFDGDKTEEIYFKDTHIISLMHIIVNEKSSCNTPLGNII